MHKSIKCYLEANSIFNANAFMFAWSEFCNYSLSGNKCIISVFADFFFQGWNKQSIWFCLLLPSCKSLTMQCRICVIFMSDYIAVFIGVWSTTHFLWFANSNDLQTIELFWINRSPSLKIQNSRYRCMKFFSIFDRWNMAEYKIFIKTIAWNLL